MKDKFATYHPIVNFIYFCVMLLPPMLLHPVILGIACVTGLLYTIGQRGVRQLYRLLPGIFTVFLISAIINPLFNHRGATKLFLLKSGNAVTLESVLYGLFAGIMLMSVILWFTCFHQVMTSDKLMQLFGKRIPATALIFTITLRFVPKFTDQIKRVADAQKGVGQGITEGTAAERVKHGLGILSITVTWAFEHSIETADSMKSRGYGLGKRNLYVRARFDRRDGWMLAGIILLSAVVFSAVAASVLHVRYYPQFEVNEMDITAMLAYLCYGILACLPIILQGWEELTWKYLRSKI